MKTTKSEEINELLFVSLACNNSLKSYAFLSPYNVIDKSHCTLLP